MRRHTHSHYSYGPGICFLLMSIGMGCDHTQMISLTAEDFRFVPDHVQAASSLPLTLSIYNAGREVHEFDSPILLYAAKMPTAPAPTEFSGSPGRLLLPGKSLQFIVAAPPGTYLYICRRKGHTNMAGTLIGQ